MIELQSAISDAILHEARKWNKKLTHREIKEVESVRYVSYTGEPKEATMYSGKEFDLFAEGSARIWVWETNEKNSWGNCDYTCRCNVTCKFVSDSEVFVVTNVRNFIILG